MSRWRNDEDIKEQFRKSDLRTKKLQDDIFSYMRDNSAKGSTGIDPKANQNNDIERFTKWLTLQ